MVCKKCRVRLVSNGMETYCPKCGLVMDRLFTLPEAELYSRGMRQPKQPWMLNIRQTRRNYGWRNGRIKLLAGARR